MNLLIFNYIFCSNSLTAQESPLWHKIVENTVSGAFILAGIIFAAWLAYRFAIRQKKRETFIGLERIKYERKLKALEECWKLLAYTTDTENAISVLTWEKVKGGNKIYYVNTANAKDFISNLAGFHYGSGLGIYISKEIKEKLFEYRSILFGFILSVKETKEVVIQIQKPEMAKKMIEIHQNIIHLIKKETDQIEKLEIKK